MSSVKDDFITKIIQKEIRDRKNKSETEDIIPTTKNSEDDGYTHLLNKMASKIKKKKRKKPKTVQVNENASILVKDDAVKLNTVMTLVDTIVPKKAKKRKRQTSSYMDGNDLKSVMMPKVKKAKMNTIKTSEDDLQQTFLLEKREKKKKKKKKKSRDFSIDEIINDYKIMSKVSDSNKTTVNTIKILEDINENTLLEEKQEKKKKKKKMKSRDLSIDEVINDYKIMSKVSDSNKTTINTVKRSEDINENTLSLEKQERKKKKKKSRDLSIDGIINDFKIMSKVSDSNKTTINTVETSGVINESTLLLEKQDKKKKKKSRDLSIDEIFNDYKIMSKVSDSNKTTFNAVERSEDLNENILSLEKQGQKKKKKKKKNKSRDLSIDEIINDYKMMSKVSDSNTTTINAVERLEDINENTLLLEKQEKKKKKKKKKSRDLNIDEIINDYKMMSKVSDSNTTTINTTKSSKDINENTFLLHEPKKKKKKKSGKVQNNKNSITQDKDDELNYIEETNNSIVSKKLKKKKKQKSCDISNNDLEANSVMMPNVPKINKVPSSFINAITSSEDLEDCMKSPNLSKTQKKKKKEKSSKNVMEAIKAIATKERNMADYEQRKTPHKKHTVIDISTVDTASSDGVSHESDTCKMSSIGLFFQDEPKTVTHVPNDRNRSIECDVCGRVFGTKFEKTWHYRTHTGEKPYMCDVCGKAFTKSSNLTIHYRTHTGDKPYACDICGKTFAFNSFLIIHYGTHTGVKPHTCDVCGKAFTRKFTLDEHYRTHSGEKPYACDVCSKAFAQKSTLDGHYRMHTGEKPCACDVCGKAFTTSSDLIRHYRTHTGEKPYMCDVCGKAFSQKCNMINHYRMHTGEKPYSCDVCGKMFAKKFNLIVHHRTHTGERPYECGLCEKSFSQSSNCNAHMLTHTRRL